MAHASQVIFYESMKFIREISGNAVPIYAWLSFSTSAALFLFGPEHIGGNGDMAKKLETITAVNEKERFEENQKVLVVFLMQCIPSLHICL